MRILSRALGLSALLAAGLILTNGALRAADAPVVHVKAEVKDAYVGQVVDQCKPILSIVERGGELQTAAASLGNWLSGNQPSNKGLYRGGANSTVLPPKDDGAGE